MYDLPNCLQQYVAIFDGVFFLSDINYLIVFVQCDMPDAAVISPCDIDALFRQAERGYTSGKATVLLLLQQLYQRIRVYFVCDFRQRFTRANKMHFKVLPHYRPGQTPPYCTGQG